MHTERGLFRYLSIGIWNLLHWKKQNPQLFLFKRKCVTRHVLYITAFTSYRGKTCYQKYYFMHYTVSECDGRKLEDRSLYYGMICPQTRENWFSPNAEQFCLITRVFILETMIKIAVLWMSSYVTAISKFRDHLLSRIGPSARSGQLFKTTCLISRVNFQIFRLSLRNTYEFLCSVIFNWSIRCGSSLWQ